MIHRSFILDTLVDLIVRTALVFSTFLLFAGHNAPGGGFIAGLVFGISLILKFVSGGDEELRRVLPATPETWLASGLLLAVLTGLSGWAWGEAFLDSVVFETDLPVLGAIKVTPALPFDLGVFAVVVGLTAALTLALGPREEPG